MTNKKLKHFLIHVILIILVVILIYPTLVAIFSSFKSLGDFLTNTLSLLPKKFTVEPWITLLNAVPALRWVINGLLISGGGALINILIATPAAYVFARSENKFLKGYFNFVVATVMLPLAAYLTPLYLVMSKLNLIDTYISVMLPISESVFGVFYLTQSFKTIPLFYEEAAWLDGCNIFSSFFKIFLPMAKEPIITIFIFTFIWKWNSFLWPLIALNDSRKLPITLGIATTVGNDISWMNSLMAGATLTILPIIIVFVFLHRYIVGSDILGGMK